MELVNWYDEDATDDENIVPELITANEDGDDSTYFPDDARKQ